MTMLSTNIHSTEELISIALEAEREAIRRYTELSEKMKHFGNEDARALFDRMVEEEIEHEKLLLEWAERDGLTLNTDVGPIRWEDPVVSTLYDDEARDPVRSTPYKALAFAVHNEERAFRFYSYVAADSDDVNVRGYAEVLAQEELGHAALIRAMRRRAWHEQRDRDNYELQIKPHMIQSKSDLLAVTVCLEEYIALLIHELVGVYPELKSLEQHTQGFLDKSRKALDKSVKPSEEVDSILNVFASRHETAIKTNTKVTSLQRLCADSDRSFEFYDSVVTSSQDESLMKMAQEHCSNALHRIEALRAATGDAYER